MDAAAAIFGNDAFRKRYDANAGRNPISKALFEAWAVTLANLTPDELAMLIERREAVRERFIDLMVQDREFEVAVSYSTGSPARVHKRFLAIEQLVVAVLSA